MERYKELQRLADAQYGQIMLCEDKTGGDKVVMKQIELKYAMLRQSRHTLRRLSEDAFVERRINVQLHQLGRHPNIVFMRETF